MAGRTRQPGSKEQGQRLSPTSPPVELRRADMRPRQAAAVIGMILSFRPQCTPPSLALGQPFTQEATATHPDEHSSAGNQWVTQACACVRVCTSTVC